MEGVFGEQKAQLQYRWRRPGGQQGGGVRLALTAKHTERLRYEASLETRARMERDKQGSSWMGKGRREETRSTSRAREVEEAGNGEGPFRG